MATVGHLRGALKDATTVAGEEPVHEVLGVDVDQLGTAHGSPPGDTSKRADKSAATMMTPSRTMTEATSATRRSEDASASVGTMGEKARRRMDMVHS